VETTYSRQVGANARPGCRARYPSPCGGPLRVNSTAICCPPLVIRGAPGVANKPKTVKPGGLRKSAIPAWRAHQVPGSRCSQANHPDSGDHYHQYLEYAGHSSPLWKLLTDSLVVLWMDIPSLDVDGVPGCLGNYVPCLLRSRMPGHKKTATRRSPSGVSFEKEIPWREFLFNTTTKL
jgi:hypothetical protein